MRAKNRRKITGLVTCRRVLKAVQFRRNGSIRSYNFLLTFHSNHGAILYRFHNTVIKHGDKISNFLNLRLFNALAEGISLGTVLRHLGQKTGMMELPD